MLKEFKKFALRGNMIDLAVGIIIGGAFSNLVNSLVNNIFMPIISLFTRNLDFTDWFFALDGQHYATLEEAQAQGVATVNYGIFISGIINFLIMAFVVFMLVKWINKLRQSGTAETPAKKKCPFCISEIDINATKCPNCTAEIPK